MFYLQINVDGFIDIASLYDEMDFALDRNFYIVFCSTSLN